MLEALDAGALGRPAGGHAALGQRRRAGARQGIGEADVVWDLAAGRASPARLAAVSRSCRSPRRPCGRACPRRSARAPASGTSAPIDSPIATATSRPTKSSSASGPIGWPAPSFMQVSIALRVDAVALEQPHGVEQVGEEQLVDDEAGRVGHLDGGLARAARRGACSSSLRVARSPRRGRTARPASSCSTGLKTCSAAKRSGRPLACGQLGDRQRRGRRGERSSSSGSSSPSCAWMSRLTSVSSATASTTMSQPAQLVEIGHDARRSRPSRRRCSADCSLRAHTTTSWCSAAARASPQAIAPLPDYSQLMSQISDPWLTGQSIE